MEAWIEKLAGLLWTWPVVIFCTAAGIIFTIRLRGIQFRSFPHAISLISGKYDDPNEHGQITHFQALAAALSGTIGLGNISGVAIAIGIGGPGAIFWMWIMGLLGMATKYVECTLGTHYRDEDPETGEVRGGPMQYIVKGLGQKWKPVAIFYGICIFMGAFGAGNMFQANQAAAALSNSFGIPTTFTGLLLAGLVGVVILGGITRIGKVASKIIPAMCVTYLVAALIICFMNISLIPSVIATIFYDAFTGIAATGGALGTVIIWGVRRAVFSNEAGLGSAAIAHAAVKTNYPIREGIVASLGPFIDTIIVCTATAMVIVLSGNFGTETFLAKGKTIDFSIQEQGMYLGHNWQINNQNIPENTDATREFRVGDNVLTYKRSGATHIPAILPAIKLTDENKDSVDGIRFSYFKEAGSFIVHLMNQNGTRLASIDLDNPETSQKLTLNGHIMENKWQSAVLTFDEALSKNGPLHLVFAPKGQNVSWHLDRIQTVNKQEGIMITTNAFDKFFSGFGSIFISLSVFFFAFSTLITWYYYGETAIEFVFGKKVIMPYKMLFVGLAFWGSINALSFVINFSDLMIGLMVIPNMTALIFLSGQVKDMTDDYFTKLKNGEIKAYK